MSTLQDTLGLKTLLTNESNTDNSAPQKEDPITNKLEILDEKKNEEGFISLLNEYADGLIDKKEILEQFKKDTGMRNPVPSRKKLNGSKPLHYRFVALEEQQKVMSL